MSSRFSGEFGLLRAGVLSHIFSVCKRVESTGDNMQDAPEVSDMVSFLPSLHAVVRFSIVVAIESRCRPRALSPSTAALGGRRRSTPSPSTATSLDRCWPWWTLFIDRRCQSWSISTLWSSLVASSSIGVVIRGLHRHRVLSSPLIGIDGVVTFGLHRCPRSMSPLVVVVHQSSSFLVDIVHFKRGRPWSASSRLTLSCEVCIATVERRHLWSAFSSIGLVLTNAVSICKGFLAVSMPIQCWFVFKSPCIHRLSIPYLPKVSILQDAKSHFVILGTIIDFSISLSDINT